MNNRQLKNKLSETVNIAKQASFKLSLVNTKTKNATLRQMANALMKNRKKIIAANKKDLTAVRRKKLSKAFLDRLTLTEKRIEEMRDSLIKIAMLVDPVGSIIKSWYRPNGLKISKVRVPIGVILIMTGRNPSIFIFSMGC